MDNIKLDKIYSTTPGDRSTTPAQKRKIKEEQDFKCAHCKKKYIPRLLEIHHKVEIHKHKDKLTGIDIPQYSYGNKIKPHYDRRSNLEAICFLCHDKTKKKKPAKKSPRRKDDFWALDF